jgi:hypothetical protein
MPSRGGSSRTRCAQRSVQSSPRGAGAAAASSAAPRTSARARDTTAHLQDTAGGRARYELPLPSLSLPRPAATLDDLFRAPPSDGDAALVKSGFAGPESVGE